MFDTDLYEEKEVKKIDRKRLRISKEKEVTERKKEELMEIEEVIKEEIKDEAKEKIKEEIKVVKEEVREIKKTKEEKILKEKVELMKKEEREDGKEVKVHMQDEECQNDDISIKVEPKQRNKPRVRFIKIKNEQKLKIHPKFRGSKIIKLNTQRSASTRIASKREAVSINMNTNYDISNINDIIKSIHKSNSNRKSRSISKEFNLVNLDSKEILSRSYKKNIETKSLVNSKSKIISGSGFRKLKSSRKYKCIKKRPATACCVSVEEAKSYINNFKMSLSDDLIDQFDNMLFKLEPNRFNQGRRNDIQNFNTFNFTSKTMFETPKEVRYEPIKMKTVRFDDEINKISNDGQIKLKNVTLCSDKLEFGFS